MQSNSCQTDNKFRSFASVLTKNKGSKNFFLPPAFIQFFLSIGNRLLIARNINEFDIENEVGVWLDATS